MSPKNLSIAHFDYELPDEKIAKHPLAQRDHCKLLVRDPQGRVSEHVFAQLPDLLPEDAMLVFNNTRVINARLRFRKHSGATIEIFCLEPHIPADYAENFSRTSSCQWICLVGNSKRWKQGSLEIALPTLGKDDAPLILRAERLGSLGNAFIIQFSWDNPTVTFASIIQEAGVIPIPPYLNRETEASDSADYQTVYSRINGSVAAPTAGLHFTDSVLDSIKERGIPLRQLTLHVGAGTFQSVKDDDVSQHQMHSEYISVPLQLIEELATTPRKVFAVGTTSVRTLESLYHIGNLIHQGKWQGEVPQWYPYSDEHPHLPMRQAMLRVAEYVKGQGHDKLIADTRIIIAPGYEYKVVKGMITNFHQPRSTLLLLVSALIGDDWRQLYDYALAHDFRFLSYGDACLLSSD